MIKNRRSDTLLWNSTSTIEFVRENACEIDSKFNLSPTWPGRIKSSSMVKISMPF